MVKELPDLLHYTKSFNNMYKGWRSDDDSAPEFTLGLPVEDPQWFSLWQADNTTMKLVRIWMKLGGLKK